MITRAIVLWLPEPLVANEQKWLVKLIWAELYLFVNNQTSCSILPFFHHNFDIFINYQQQFIVFFGEKRSGTKPTHSQKYSGNFICLYKSLQLVRNPLIFRHLRKHWYRLRWTQNNLNKHFEQNDNHTHEQYCLLEAYNSHSLIYNTNIHAKYPSSVN